MEKQALWDMDGTLADFSKGINEGMQAIAAPGEIIAEEFDEEPEYMKRRRRLIKAQPGFWRNLERIPDGFTLWGLAEDLGFKPMVLSKGPSWHPQAWAEKVEWCHKHLGHHVPITLGEDKSLVYGKVLFDDWPPYFLSWLKVRPRGLVVSVAQEWNKGIEHPNYMRFDGSEGSYREIGLRLAKIVG